GIQNVTVPDSLSPRNPDGARTILPSRFPPPRHSMEVTGAPAPGPALRMFFGPVPVPVAPGDRRSTDGAAPLQGPTEGELVGVFEITADGEPARDTGDLDAERPQQAAQVHGGRLALDVGVGAEDDLGDPLRF